MVQQVMERADDAPQPSMPLQMSAGLRASVRSGSKAMLSMSGTCAGWVGSQRRSSLDQNGVIRTLYCWQASATWAGREGGRRR